MIFPQLVRQSLKNHAVKIGFKCERKRHWLRLYSTKSEIVRSFFHLVFEIHVPSASKMKMDIEYAKSLLKGLINLTVRGIPRLKSALILRSVIALIKNYDAESLSCFSRPSKISIVRDLILGLIKQAQDNEYSFAFFQR